MDAKVPAREMFDLPNTALRFLFDEKQSQTSAAILLQWCIDPDAIEYMTRYRIDNPLILITVVSPNEKEERFVVPLFQMEMRLAFHRAGVHKILGRIIWDIGLKSAKNLYLAWHTRGSYNTSIDAIKARLQALGNAELQLDVPPDFFAPPLSSWDVWWLQLWWGELWDACDIRKRRALAWGIQGPCVLVWVICNCIARFLSAAFLSGMLLERKVHWEAVLHPFEYDFEYIWDSGYGTRRSWRDCCVGSVISYDSNGQERSAKARWLWLFFPPVQIAIIAAVSARIYFFPPQESPGVEVAAQTYAISLGGIVMLVLFVILVALLSAGISSLVTHASEKLKRVRPADLVVKKEKKPSLFYLWLQKAGSDLWKRIYGPMQEYARHRRELVHVRRNEMYEELSCARVPEQGIRPLTTMTAAKFSRMPRLVFDRLKASPLVCKPMQRG